MDRRLEPYRALVPFLGQALGPDYEVALHDLTGETGAVAALANGGVTGQSLGAPLCGMARRFVQDGLWRTREFVTGYQAESAAKGRLRASALFIRDGEVFHKLYRGEQRREQFYQKISDTLTMLATGGDRA